MPFLTNGGTVITMNLSKVPQYGNYQADDLGITGLTNVIRFNFGDDLVFTTESQGTSYGEAVTPLLDSGSMPKGTIDKWVDGLDEFKFWFDLVWLGESSDGSITYDNDSCSISFSFAEGSTTTEDGSVRTGARNTYDTRPTAAYYESCYEDFFAEDKHKAYLGMAITGFHFRRSGSDYSWFGDVTFSASPASSVKGAWSSTGSSFQTITDSRDSTKSIYGASVNTFVWNGCAPEVEECGVNWISTDKTDYLCTADTGKWHYKIKPLKYAPVYANVTYNSGYTWTSSNNFSDITATVSAEGGFSTPTREYTGECKPQLYTNIGNNFYCKAYNASLACWHYADIGTWTINPYTEPTVSDVTVERVTDEQHQDTLSGTVTWAADALSPGYRDDECEGKGVIVNSKTGETVSTFDISLPVATGEKQVSEFADTTILAAGTPYTLTVTVSSLVDASGSDPHEASFSKAIPCAFFLMDFDGSTGKSIGIGQEAASSDVPDNGRLDISMDANLHAPVTMDSTLTVGGAISAPYLVGSIQMYGGATAPTGWLLCDGSAVSRTTYAKLFEVLGTAYGEGDGSTTFNVPNFSGRFPIGSATTTPQTNTASCGFNGGNQPYSYNSSGGLGWFNLGEYGGEARHTLTTAEMPSHTHGASSEWKSLSGTFRDLSWGGGSSGIVTSGTNALDRKADSGSKFGAVTRTVNASHSHTITVNATGSGGAHNQMPPFVSVNYIVYAG